MNVTTKQNKNGVLTTNTKEQTVTLAVEGQTFLVAYLRDNKVKIKSDLFLNDGDMAYVMNQMQQFVKKTEATGKKRK